MASGLEAEGREGSPAVRNAAAGEQDDGSHLQSSNTAPPRVEAHEASAHEASAHEAIAAVPSASAKGNSGTVTETVPGVQTEPTHRSRNKRALDEARHGRPRSASVVEARPAKSQLVSAIANGPTVCCGHVVAISVRY